MIFNKGLSFGCARAIRSPAIHAHTLTHKWKLLFAIITFRRNVAGRAYRTVSDTEAVLDVCSTEAENSHDSMWNIRACEISAQRINGAHLKHKRTNTAIRTYILYNFERKFPCRLLAVVGSILTPTSAQCRRVISDNGKSWVGSGGVRARGRERESEESVRYTFHLLTGCAIYIFFLIPYLPSPHRPLNLLHCTRCGLLRLGKAKLSKRDLNTFYSLADNAAVVVVIIIILLKNAHAMCRVNRYCHRNGATHAKTANLANMGAQAQAATRFLASLEYAHCIFHADRDECDTDRGQYALVYVLQDGLLLLRDSDFKRRPH